MITVIKSNKAKCLICGEVIESKTVHELRTCECGNLSVDGGLHYLRRLIKDNQRYEELSDYEEE